MISAFIPSRIATKTASRSARRAQAATAAVALLPLMALAFASLESAILYAAGQLLGAFGAR